MNTEIDTDSAPPGERKPEPPSPVPRFDEPVKPKFYYPAEYHAIVEKLRSIADEDYPVW